MWKEAAVAEFKSPSKHFHGRTEENRQEYQPK
jgi:hypothetical protein